MIYLINGLVLSLATLLIGRKQPDQIWFFTGMILKLSAGLLLGWIFMNYYKGSDTFEYFDAAKSLTELPYREYWLKIRGIEIGHFPNQPRAILFTKIVSVLILLTKGDYWIVSLYFSFVSFLAYWFFYRQIITTLPNLKWPVIIGFLLLPSTIFWSSGILKGAITNASLVFLSAMCLKLFFRKKIHPYELFLSAISLVILLYIKYYLLILLGPLIIYTLFDIRAHRMGIAKNLRASVYLVILIVTVFAAPSVNPNLNLADLPIAIHDNQHTFENDHTIDVHIEPNWYSLLATLPKSMVIGLFGPTLADSGKMVGLIPRTENVLIFIFTLFSVILLFKQRLFQPDILVMSVTILVLILAAMLPLAAPNYGALIRYRAPITPFLVMMVTILPVWWIQEKLNR